MAKKRRSSQFKESSQVIDIEEARRKRQEKRQRQQKKELEQQRAEADQKKPVRASVKAGRRKKNIVYAVIILAIIAAIGASILNIVSLKAEYKEAEKMNQQLTQEKKELEQQIKDSDDKEFIEKEAREQLRMVNPGETVYIVPYSEEKAAGAKESEKK